MYKKILSFEEIKDFKKTILDFYYSEGKSLPWRDTQNPYHILVSEIMLQQTQIDRVLPKYEQWLSLFPTIESLAKASIKTVYEAWSGLGYNRRARFLQEACMMVYTTMNGILPSESSELQKLPGLGSYTAGAVSTFAFNKPNVFIETNIRSVFIFFFYKNQTDVLDKDLLLLIEQTLDTKNPRIWYYALMDYGSMLKKKTINPNRVSKHYQKQSKFEGSHRQARGAFLKYLSSMQNPTIEEIAEASGISYERLKKASIDLINENFVSETKGVFSFYSD